MEDGTKPAYAEEMAQDVIMFVGTRWCFMIFFSFKVPQTGKGKRERGMVCCSRLVGGDVEGEKKQHFPSSVEYDVE